MKILGIDIGYSYVKCTFGEHNKEQSKMFKFPSVVGIVERNEYIKDGRALDFKEHSYYVGEEALSLPSENMIDITVYDKLEYYAPLFLCYAIKMIGETPDMIVTGLSKSQIQNSGYFKDALSEFIVNNIKYKFDSVFVIPQGAGCKVCSDIYGLSFDGQKTEFSSVQNYIGVDGGFNTIDIYRVINGKTSSSTFDGLENAGVMKIASQIAKLIKEKHNRNISLHEANEVITSGHYKLRSDDFDYTNEVLEIKKKYILDMLDIIENKYGKVLDKCECVYFSGGASRLFNSCVINGNKIVVPTKNNEFLNSIGQYIFGKEQYEKLNK